MDFNHLCFLKCDTLLFAQQKNYQLLKGIINNQLQFIKECQGSGLQLALYELLKILDVFFSPDRIIDVVKSRQYTDDELFEIQVKTTHFRILIECEKFYANHFWINKKRQWVVEIRILASLLRIYNFLSLIRDFFAGDYINIKTRIKKSKQILPLNMLEVFKLLTQPFINSINHKLQQIEPFYYKYDFSYMIQLHVLFKAFKKLLFEFPTITKNDIVTNFDLEQIIFAQNQKYKKKYAQKFLKINQSPLKKIKQTIRPRRNTDIVLEEQNKWKSLDTKKPWARRFSMNIKMQKLSNSLQVTSTLLRQYSPTSSSLPFKPIVIDRRDKKFTQQSLQRTNSECASTRNISDSRSYFPSKFSGKDEHGTSPDLLSSKFTMSPRETMSPTRIPKALSRRTILQSFVLGTVKQQAPKLSSADFEDNIRQKQPFQYTLMKYHSGQVRDNRARKNSQKLTLGEDQLELIGRPSHYKQNQIQQKVQYILLNSNNKINNVKRKKQYSQSILNQ